MNTKEKAAPGANRAASSSAFDGEIIAEIPKNDREVYRITLEVLPEIVTALAGLIEGERR